MTSVVSRSALATVAVIAIWAVLADRNPANTYHFAPLIGALSGPWLAQSTLGRQSPRTALPAIGVSVALVLIAGVVLRATDRLGGPTFWGDGGAITEVVIFALVGGLFGWFLLGPRPELRLDDAQ